MNIAPPVTADAVAGLRALAALLPALKDKALVSQLAELDDKLEEVRQREEAVALQVGDIGRLRSEAEAANADADARILAAEKAEAAAHKLEQQLLEQRQAQERKAKEWAAERDREAATLRELSTDLGKREADVHSRETAVTQREERVGKREAEVEAKLERLKSIVA